MMPPLSAPEEPAPEEPAAQQLAASAASEDYVDPAILESQVDAGLRHQHLDLKADLVIATAYAALNAAASSSNSAPSASKAQAAPPGDRPRKRPRGGKNREYYAWQYGATPAPRKKPP